MYKTLLPDPTGYRIGKKTNSGTFRRTDLSASAPSLFPENGSAEIPPDSVFGKYTLNEAFSGQLFYTDGLTHSTAVTYIDFKKDQQVEGFVVGDALIVTKDNGSVHIPLNILTEVNATAAIISDTIAQNYTFIIIGLVAVALMGLALFFINHKK